MDMAFPTRDAESPSPSPRVKAIICLFVLCLLYSVLERAFREVAVWWLIVPSQDPLQTLKCQ